jgi:hypothetical protein
MALWSLRIPLLKFKLSSQLPRLDWYVPNLHKKTDVFLFKEYVKGCWDHYWMSLAKGCALATMISWMNFIQWKFNFSSTKFCPSLSTKLHPSINHLKNHKMIFHRYSSMEFGWLMQEKKLWKNYTSWMKLISSYDFVNFHGWTSIPWGRLRFYIIHKNRYKENMKLELKTFQFAFSMFQIYWILQGLLWGGGGKGGWA